MNASKVRRSGRRKNRKNDWKSLTDGLRTDSKSSTNGLRKNGMNGWKKNGRWAYCQFPFFFVNFYTESITYRFSSHVVDCLD